MLLAEAHVEGAKKLQAQLVALPDVATVDLVNTSDEGEEGRIPSAAELSAYDVVVSIGDNGYLDPVAWGNSLADFLDSGGVVVQSAYDNWEDPDSFPQGRFSAGGYAPFIPGDNVNEVTSLGAFNGASPLMQGVNALTTEDNTAPTLAPGAALIAQWVNGNPAIAQKGRVVSVTAFIGDHNGDVWTGDYGRVVLNAVRTLGRQVLTVANANPAGGTVTSSAGGIACGVTCSASFIHQTLASLTATANPGFVFAGFTGACTGTACNLTMDTPKSVTANFFPLKKTSFSFKKIKRNKNKGTAQLTVEVGGPGRLVLNGGKVKTRSKSAAEAGKVILPIIAKGKAIATLESNGKAKVKFKVAYTPTDGSTTTLTKSVVLRLKSDD
ncbi:MAG TPA: hypothetical protein VFI03_05595 [Solirubrobacterales bacterium]|nr:hypothetical protein [Solirubrobacterales bacterium]